MKVPFLNVGIVCAALLLFSCNSSESENVAGEKSVSTSTTSKSNKKTASCLAKFNHDYSKLLTEEDVLKHISSISNAEELKIKYDAKSAQNYPEYGEIYYTWPSDRPGVQLSPSFPSEHPDDNTISLTNLAFQEGDVDQLRKRFQTAYQEMSKEEIDAGIERLEKSYKDKPAEELETAKGFLQARGKSKNKPVEGVGDYAYWYPTSVMGMKLGSKIVVLAGNAQFEVVAKVSENDEENFEMAKKIALEVLSKCN